MSKVSKENVAEIYPLSPVQDALFQSLPESGASAELRQRMWILEGGSDEVLRDFEHAFSHLVERHPMLRTIFFRARAQPVQIVLKSLPIPLTVCDLRQLRPGDRHGAAARFATEDLAPGVETRQGPLVRAALLRFSEQETRFVLTYSPLLLDRESLRLLLADLQALYGALQAGTALPAAGFPPYKDFITWRSRQDREEILDFWAWEMEGFEKATPLPIDRRVAAGRPRHPASRSFALTRGTSGRLEALARENQVGADIVAQAAWAIFLARYSGEADVVFGLAVGGRQIDLPDCERMIGPFGNILPARHQIDARTDLPMFLRAVAQRFIDLEQHSHVSLTEIQSRSAISSSRKLFESVLATAGEDGKEALSLHPLRLVASSEGGLLGEMQLDLMTEMTLGELWQVELTYAQETFAAATVKRLAASFEHLLDSIGARAQARLGELEILSPAEREQLLVEFNRTDPLPELDRFAHEIFEEQVREQGDAIAAVCGEERLSYAELNARANRVAHWLRARGVGRESRVGGFGERGLDMLTVILGILKAGAAWVPLDPAHPDARVATILAASGVSFVAVQGEMARRFQGITAQVVPPPELFCWDAAPAASAIADAGEIARESAENLPCHSAPHDLANVFHTSGSTGMPKGVMVEQVGMLNHLWAKVALLRLDRESVVVQNASHCFDISMWQFLAPLLVGGRTVIYRDETALQPETLLAAIEQDAVTVMETVPTLLNVLLEEVVKQRAAGEEARLTALQFLISNAETLPVPFVKRWFELFPGIPLVNTYGATECSDDTTHHVLAGALPANAPRVGVGRPIPGFAIYVLDRRLEPVPVGSPGQIAMAGVGVGRGYLGAAATTAATYVPHPFGDRGGARLYLTGDLGHFTAEGVLQFLGRIDNQVKVRGYRIELEEIEAVLARHPSVQRAAVLARAEDGGTNRLVACFVAGGRQDVSELRQFLEGSLPPYMLPEQFVELEAMPLNRNGKIDRAALGRLAAWESTVSVHRDHVAPRDEIEARIAEVWQEVLEVGKVSVRDNFYDLGGHSLMGIQVRSRIRHHPGVDLPLASILEYPVLEDLASEVRRLMDQGEKRAQGGEKIPVLPQAEHYALSHAQRQLWFMHRLDPADISYNTPLRCLLEGRLDAVALQKTFRALLERHASYRTCFTMLEGEPVQRIVSPDSMDDLELVDLSHLAEEERTARVQAVMREDMRTPFDLERPPVRAHLLKLAPERHLMILVFHHIISDFWSARVLIHDLTACYQAFIAEESPSLPPVSVRYVDYAAWQDERFRQGKLEASEQYWLEKLVGELPVLDLPAIDAPRASSKIRRSTTVSVSWDEAVVSSLRKISEENGSMLFATLLAVVNAFFFRATGQTDILLGTPSANRDHVDIENVIGFFVNMLALRTDLKGDPSFLEALDRTRQVTYDAFAHQEYPFDLLVQRLNPDRELGVSPIFTAMFTVMEASAKDSEIRVTDDLVMTTPELDDEFTTPYQFNVVFFDQGKALQASFIYDSGLYEDDVVDRLARRLKVLLEGIVTDPRQQVSALPLLSREEQEELRLRAFPSRELYPLSFPQQDIWFQCQLVPDPAIFHISMDVRISGRPDPAALAAATRTVIGRHAGLRAGFPTADGQVVHYAPAELEPDWADVDFSELDPNSRDARVAAWKKRLIKEPFDLRKPPLCRFGLARLGDSAYLMVMVMHHLVIDGVNIMLFLRQVIAAYPDPGAESFPELACDYPDFALWQASMSQARIQAPQKTYWREKLAGALPGFELPTDRPRPSQRTFDYERIELSLTRPRLKELGEKGFGSTQFTILLAAAKLLFHRVTGHRDILVAAPLSTRPVKLARSVGLFTSVWPLLTDLAGDPDFGTLVDRVSATLREAGRNNAESFNEVLSELQVAREGDRPLIPISVVQLGNFHAEREDLSFEIELDMPGLLFDLWLRIVQDFEAPKIFFEYNDKLFDRSTIARLVRSFDVLLEEITARPRARLSELGLLSAAERQNVLVDFNEAEGHFPRRHFAHQIFEQRADDEPRAIAALYEGESLSYYELNARANQTARWLLSHGAGRESRIGLFGERGPGMLATMLGVLKAGGAFVPLDSRQPDARLRLILRSAGLHFIATQGNLVERGLDLGRDLDPAPRVLCWDEAPPETGVTGRGSLAAFDTTNPGRDTGPHDLAYVCYTSGSTGLPKGAMVEQGGMINHLAAKIELLGLDRDSVMVQNSSHVFDIAVWQSLAALLVGGRVAIYPREVAVDPWKISAALERDGATVIQEVPSFVSAMVDVLEQAGAEKPGFASLTHLICHAETLSPALCRRWFRLFPHTTLINAYGITECSDDMTHHVMRQPPAQETELIAVGKTIPHLRHYVVGRYLQPLPVGFIGQITMAGVGVGRGYLGDPARTARVIVPDPFAGEAGGRLYLTGDQGRWRDGGILEFLGRRDHQVKIRGFRIEIGEIEAALRRHSSVSEAVLAVHEAAGGTRLAAYVVPRPATEPAASELRDFLAGELPDYMVPAAFVMLETLPRTSTGKVDRLGLPEPEVDGSERQESFVAPRTPGEELLAGIWADVLGLDPQHVGVHDGFFDLGGDSILSIRIVSQANRAGLAITVKDFFQHQTIAELVTAVEAHSPTVPAPQEPTTEGDMPLGPAQHRIFRADIPRPHHLNMAKVFELKEVMDPRYVEAAIGYLVAHHGALRLRFSNDGGSWHGVTAPTETSSFFQLVDLGSLPDPLRRDALEAFASRLQSTLDLGTGPLLRVAYFDLGSEMPARLLLIIHHLVMDVVSWQILLEDLITVYHQLVRGGTIRPLPRTTSFQHWFRLLAEHARSGRAQQELLYWLDHLPKQVFPLPTDHAQGPPTWRSIREIASTLSGEETEILLRKLPAVYDTQIQDVLLTALVEAVSLWAGERSLVVQMGLHGREAILENVDLSRTIGWFASFFPLFLDLREARDPARALKSVQETLRHVPDRGIGYGLLRYLTDDGEIARQLAERPEGDFLFEYLGQMDRLLPESLPIAAAQESAGVLVDARNAVPWTLALQASIRGGQLRMLWGYSENLYRQSTIEALAERFIAALRSLSRLAERPRDSTAQDAKPATLWSEEVPNR